MSKIPNKWIMAPLYEVAQINPRWPDREVDDDSQVSFIPMAAVEEETGRLDPSEVRQWKDVRRGYTRFQEADILFAKITPCMENGKVALAERLVSGVGAGSTEFYVVRTGAALLPRFALHYLLQNAVRRDARQVMQGAAGQLRVPRSFLHELEVPLPPLPEQERIVSEIDAQVSRIDAATSALERVRTNLKRYTSSVLAAAAYGKLIQTPKPAAFNLANWKPVQNAVESMDQGWSPRCERYPASSREWGVIKTTAIQPLSFHGDENKKLPDNLEPRQNLELRVNDILVTRAGPRNRVGVVCMVRATRRQLMLCDKAYRLRLRSEIARPKYMEIILNSPPVQSSINQMKSGISDSGVNLTQKRFKDLRVPLPSLEIQEEIENAVDTALSMVVAIDSTISQQLVRAGRLRQSILKRAFEGRLVQQDPADEPASVILKRIRAERYGG